ncbi:MAG TPA: AAA family ATPase [Thermodesulfovibrionales bacterium]|nr:AAA family ATPase [Thermodesulfovibrionales bacterium]
MYEAFYGFKSRPFSKTPDPRFLFMSRTHEEALARLQYAVEEREIAVLTGEIGCGKTTLTRALMDSLGDKHRVIFILNPRLTSFDFVKTVSERLQSGISSPHKSDLLDAIYAKLYDDYRSGITPVVIIDEAHLIPYRETFEEIRLLTNFQMDETNLLSLILVGQPDLRRKLELPSLLAFRQRVGLFCHLDAISEDEIASYINYRVAAGGRNVSLFTDAALSSLYRCSGGIPRVINNLAHMSLLEGFARDSRMIDEGLVYSAAKEIGLNGHCKDKEKA